jgi:hypothetical protein
MTTSSLAFGTPIGLQSNASLNDPLMPVRQWIVVIEDPLPVDGVAPRRSSQPAMSHRLGLNFGSFKAMEGSRAVGSDRGLDDAAGLTMHFSAQNH